MIVTPKAKEAIQTVFMAACVQLHIAEARPPSPEREKYLAVCNAITEAWPDIINESVRELLGDEWAEAAKGKGAPLP